MRPIDADAFISFLWNASKSQRYKSVKIGKFLTVEDVLEAVISELDGTSLDGYKNAPTIEPLQQWIPCSERLPEGEQIVLVTYKTTDRLHLCQYHEDGSYNPWYSFIDGCRAHNNVVVAWMPLPQPYKADMRGEQNATD